MTGGVLKAVETLLGRQTLWRLGRRLYVQAREETGNTIETNGEGALQRRLVRAAASEGRGLVALDVGANVGAWTLSLLDHARDAGCRDVTVHAFEPVPPTFESLCDNVSAANADKQVTCVREALSNVSGDSKIFVSGADAGTNSLLPEAAGRGEDTLPFTIRVNTALAYCEQSDIDRIDLLKIDAEGHDLAVLEGALGLLEMERVQVCQFEYNHCWVYARHFLKDVFELAASLPNYRVGKVCPDAIWLYEDWHPELERFFESNYVLVHASAEEPAGAVRGAFCESNTFQLSS